ncbi:DUF481 domain-containing protein [Aquimarina brevivitae]|uniref:Uncharacterized protein DUF481 n=1 Tax=Aquimarina brevivitae TaxID=323412 RepID=A0A4Q7NWZ8_9FLAO|nr:DUF481 domain-containing protein [Aquimarina brevivitae]RZS91876.1 uncharacterized protein DUF481 [Aquimarina brevivitae]
MNHWLCVLFFFTATLAHFGQTDSLSLKNGDHLIGEIKKMENGILTFETSYSDDDFTILWVDVVAISSNQMYLITLSNGDRCNSELKSHDKQGIVNVYSNGQFREVSIKDIVYVKPVKSSFISRLDASLSFGLNFTKSKNLKQLTLRSKLGYSANFWQLTGAYDYVRSSQENIQEIERIDAHMQFTYFLQKDIFALFRSDILSNDEQKLALRVNNRLGAGKYFIHSNQLYFGAGGGLAYNNEEFSGSTQESRSSLEAFCTVALDLFDIRDFELVTNFTAFPSITESGRWRFDYKLDLKYDLPLEFFIKIGVTYNYDNQPVEGASENDYILQTTFGWEL